MPVRISQASRRTVRERAGGLCEYCHTAERWQYVAFTVDHVSPVSAGGTSEPDNLALACFHCNRRKGNLLTAVDPEFGVEVPLFNPQQQTWGGHFAWSADKLRFVGLTATGRATVAALDLNRERVLLIRAADATIQRHPPIDDPIQKA